MDYINKQQVLEKAREYQSNPFGISLIIAEIEKMSGADVEEVRYGKWNLHPDGSGTCSLCGRTQKGVWDFDNAQEYCGKCGAKLEVG